MIGLDRRWRLVALALLLGGCGPGLLGDPSFGSAADEVSESNATPGTSVADSGPEGTSFGDEAPTAGTSSASSSASEGPGTSASESGSATTLGSETGSSSEDTASTSSAGSDSTNADEGNWGIPPDVTNEPCNPLAQDCFPTHKCVPYATVPGSTFLDANKCMPILGDKGWGEPCTLSNFNEAQDDCDGEGFCWNLEWVQGELQGSCVPFCVGSPQNLMCPIGWGCFFSGAVALCDRQCNPLLQDCPNQYACYWINEAFQCSLTGSPGGDAQPCNQANDCTPGLACVAKASVPGCPGNATTCCTPYCELDAPNCAAPRECAAFFGVGEAPPGFENLGVCLKP